MYYYIFWIFLLYVFEGQFMRIFVGIFKMLLNWAPEAEDQALLHASSGGEHGV